MYDYEIDEAIESVMAELDEYDYALESFDKVAINALTTVGSIIYLPYVIGNQLAEVPIGLLSAANIRALTKDAIKSRDPKQIKNVIKAIKYRANMHDRRTSVAKLYTMTSVVNSGSIYHAEQVQEAAAECLPKLERALKECEHEKRKGRGKGKYSSDDLWDY